MTTPAPTAATTSPTPAVEPPTRFRDLLAAEWIKTRSLRSTPWTIALTVLTVIGAAAVSALTLYDDLPEPVAGARHAAVFIPSSAYPPGGYWTLILIAAGAGALTVVSEYGSGLIRTTTVAVPARGSVVLAKAVVVAGLWTAVGVTVSTGSFLVSQAILDGRDAGVPLSHPGVYRALAASALLAPVCALVGLGLGVLLRHAAATMTTSALVLLMLPPVFSEGTRWTAVVNHAMPVSAWRRLVQPWEPDPDSLLAHTATVPGSWAVYLLWPLVAVALAVLVIRHRDV
ncbi:ABC transporter permease [Streptomyces sp. JJ38]|uniref:ABC transporter permease n=1 Tax=Streptomyces sp. JJ38 TaxID=2738128 RepID=UPI001C59D423|nr:ABC transporter permease [Streptomyces sp. JJ38]MBW1598611.1 ABC transporter permease [Streptomyces sp. JJ38]